MGVIFSQKAKFSYTIFNFALAADNFHSPTDLPPVFEKALTAVALLFSIFELNPAPFCLLDEVDASLDDTNVGRFCEVVKEMSSSVQFVVITHNKTTMELTKQLIGVTMSEPGDSRLVSVDIDEAVAMTEDQND